MDNSSTVVGNRSHKLPGQGLCILSPTLDEMVDFKSAATADGADDVADGLGFLPRIYPEYPKHRGTNAQTHPENVPPHKVHTGVLVPGYG